MANPYSGGGNASTGGGGGGWNTLTTDTVTYGSTNLPSLNILNKFTTTYIVTSSTLADLREFYWSLISDIMSLLTASKDAIISIYALPLNALEVPGTDYYISLGRWDSNYTGKIPNNQFIIKDFGTVSIEKYSGSFLDYEGTQVSLYLPYIGTVELDPKIVMGQMLKLQYVIDVYSGNLTAMVFVGSGSTFNLTYQFSGNCIYTLPISAPDFTNLILNTAKTAASIYSTVLTGLMAI